MNETRKPQRTFLAVTAITVIAIATVFMVYAAVLSTYYGGNVTVVSTESAIYYSKTNSSSLASWTATLPNVGNGSNWYAYVNFTGAGYQGLVKITWTLENQTSGWNPVSGAPTIVTTNVNLDGNPKTVFASQGSSGQTTNTNWGTYSLWAGTYHIKVVIEQA